MRKKHMQFLISTQKKKIYGTKFDVPMATDGRILDLGSKIIKRRTLINPVISAKSINNKYSVGGS